jgi:hypothetical protein
MNRLVFIPLDVSLLSSDEALRTIALIGPTSSNLDAHSSKQGVSKRCQQPYLLPMPSLIFQQRLSSQSLKQVGLPHSTIVHSFDPLPLHEDWMIFEMGPKQR